MVQRDHELSQSNVQRGSAHTAGGARESVGNSSGGEVVIHNPQGTSRDLDSIAPGNDPAANQ